MTVTFIGHADTPQTVEAILKKEITRLIERENADLFYIGTHGDFDFMAKKCILGLQKIYPHIKCFSVLAYLPRKCDEYTDYSKTIYLEGIENVPKRFAIIKRNEWMIEHSHTVICYVKNHFSNAYKFLEFAQRKGKRIIYI